MGVSVHLPAIVRIHSVLKQCYATLREVHTTMKTIKLKNLHQQWKDIQANTGATNGGELLQLIAREIPLGVCKFLFKLSVHYGFFWLGKRTAPYMFAPSISKNFDVHQFSYLMGRYTHLQSAEIILLALQYGPDDLRAKLFTKSVRIHSIYYTDKLIPPVVSKDGIVALIQHNNIPMLGKILKKDDLSFIVAASAVLNHTQLLETFEPHVNFSEVVQFIDGENWRDYDVYCCQSDKENLVAKYQNKLLQRAIQNEISHTPANQDVVTRRRM